MKQVTGAISNLKNRKALGGDNIPKKLIKILGIELVKLFKKIIFTQDIA